MFFGLGRTDFSLSRQRRALPIVVVLLVVAMLFAAVSLRFMWQVVRRAELQQTKDLLAAYLSVHRLSTGFSGSSYLHQEHLLPELLFVRVSRGGDQMLLLSGDGGITQFKEILDISPDTTAVWLPVDAGGKRRYVTVVSQSKPGLIQIQAGKDSSESVMNYHRLVWVVTCTVLAIIPVCWVASLLLVRISVTPVVSTSRRLATLGDGENEELAEYGNGPEIDELHRQLNKLVRQNRRLVNTMQQSLDSVAHDLRTPMTRLRSVAEYGLQGDDDPFRLKEVLSDCLEESERVLAMLKIMMSVAEAEAGTMRLRVEPVDLVAQLEQVVGLYLYVAEEKKIDLTFTSSGIVFVAGDQTRLSQVWANLIDNGIKYGREGGWVRVALSVEGNEALVRIADNGMGISVAEKDKIWERLYRGDRSRSQQGLGLGLSYVRAVVQAHGGTVAVESALQRGSIFTVRLPLVQERIGEKSQTRGE